MKKIICLFIFTIVIVSCRNAEGDKFRILIPGLGFDNVRIGKTTISDVIFYFGDKYKTDTFYVRPIAFPSFIDTTVYPKTEIYSIKVSFDTLGMDFYFNPKNKYLFSISLRSPIYAKTKKGIILNKSTFNDIIKIYGDSSWSFTGDEIMKCYDGICFKQKFKGDPTFPEEKLKPYLNNKVTEIVIIRPNKDYERSIESL